MSLPINTPDNQSLSKTDVNTGHKIEIISLPLNFPKPKSEKPLTKEDVWGKWSEGYSTEISKGMIIAKHGEKCPIFEDVLPYKTVTLKGPVSKAEEIFYWAEYVHGAGCIEKTKMIGDELAVRCGYNAW